MPTCFVCEVIRWATGEVWWLVPNADVKDAVVDVMGLAAHQANNIVVLPAMMTDGAMISDGGIG
jgi:hypothetical protein